MSEQTKERIHCRSCKHYRVSWDPKRPYACSLFDIKSKEPPMVIVKMASGNDCTGYEKKQPKKEYSYF